ncbi:MAG: exodeoxyribonuclease VII large subunit [Bacilli bacterium]|nr:exodeoxyribonuclease VII large subunit [Bacilli bacterium]
MEESNKYITVSQLNRYIKYKIDNDENLDNIFLKGEISNFKAHTRGHFYFTLKDEHSRVNAIMFQSNAKNIKFNVVDGMKVLVTGKLSVYEASGAYQIYVEDMLEDGVGNLYIAFEQLKEKLEKEGLFKEEHKKKIPKIPKRIGIITASTGAAIKDILSTIKRRWPLVETILFPSLVQGEFAKDNIVENIKKAENYDLDVLIVGRGGGSIEDLWPFNEEMVARAIYNCTIPVISAVGHEIDFTIADFVSDMRAPTPTGAAEMAVPNIVDVKSYINQVNLRLNNSINTIISKNRERLNNIVTSSIFKNPKRMYEIKEQMFDILYEKLLRQFNITLDNKRHLLDVIKSSIVFKTPLVIINNKSNNYLNLLNKLEVLNPITTIKRGYSITKMNNKVITNINDIKKGDKIANELKNGYLECEVLEVYEND